MMLMSIKLKLLKFLCLAFVFALNTRLATAQANATDGAASQPPSQNIVEPAASSPRQQTAAPEILIGGGDLLEISILGAPDSAKQVRVSSGGDISLPLIGPAKVAGLSISQAEQLVAKRLIEGGYFVDPQVSIFVKEYATQGISVLGEVQKPGIYPLLGSHKLFDAISAAGGTTARAAQIAQRRGPSSR